ncbi:hypothetical protein F2Q70_00001918 [Brassica cretica]|uniref:Uncharacterized protein n=1 Tax=Brassica cretica TaxID=69181 RepID=A0A8S9J186_BRACR|nr:hypothetical protein F2Q70_00001918 [Brassica cretica]
MSSSNQNAYFRSWMDHNHQDPSTGLLTEEFAEGLGQFKAFASNHETTLQMVEDLWRVIKFGILMVKLI